jgi:hypothetical protein
MAPSYLLRCFFPFLSLVLFIGCSNDEPTEVSRSHDAEAGGELRLVIRWGGDDLASRQDIELRSKVERLIEERAVGRVLRSGTGMGWMDVWVKVENKTSAKKTLEAIMKEVAPQTRYSIAFPSPSLPSSQP